MNPKGCYWPTQLGDLILTQLFGPKKPVTQQQVIRQHRREKVDIATGEILEGHQSTKVIIGWIDRETGEITPNPEASKIAKRKGVM